MTDHENNGSKRANTQADDVALFTELLTPSLSQLDTVDIAFLNAWVDEGIISFDEYADQLAWRGMTL